MLPEADVVVLEETFKARSVLNSLLKVMNERNIQTTGLHMTYRLSHLLVLQTKFQIQEIRKNVFLRH